MKKTEQTFDEAELALLKEALKRSYKERFEMATRLYKIQQTMNKAVITHKNPAVEFAKTKYRIPLIFRTSYLIK